MPPERAWGYNRSMQFRPGDLVYHRWMEPSRRPIGVPGEYLGLIRADRIGVIIGQDDHHPSFWHINIDDGDVTSWKDDLICLAS